MMSTLQYMRCVFSLLLMLQQCMEVNAVAKDRIQFWKGKTEEWKELSRVHLEKKPRDKEVNMSVAQAFQALAGKNKLPRSVQSFVQASIADHTNHHRIKEHSFLGESEATHKKGLDDSLKILNKMRYEAILEMDVEMERCESYHATAEMQLETATQAMNGFNAQAAKADGRVMEARGRQDQAMQQMEELRSLLEEHESKCKQDVKIQRQQIDMIQRDMNTANQVMGLTKCKAALMQCSRPHVGKGKNPMLLELRHNTTRIIQHVVETAENVKTGRIADALLQTSSKHRRHHREQSTRTIRRNGHRHSHNRHHHEMQSPRAAALAVSKIVDQIKSIHTSPDAVIPVSDDPMDTDMQEEKCTINNNPNCEKFVDSMMTIVGETSCKMTDMEEAVNEAQEKCETIKGDYESQIEDLQARADDAAVDMAVGTKDKNAAELQSRLKHDELFSMDEDFETQMHECDMNFQAADETLCGVESIRMELFKMDGQRPFIQDCEVSEWIHQPCTVTCGGGEALKTRSVITPPTKGSACPPVTARTDCNNFECPVNCKMAEWEEWGKCSADCNSGIKERSRAVEIPASHGGDPCENDHITQVCNTFSCDSHCILSPWSEWSPCSKACNGGFQVQKKTVVQPKRGDGQCPPPNMQTEQYRKCNVKACTKKDLKCNSKLDVVLLIDGSGSVGTTGFDLTKAFAEKLVAAFNMGQELAQMAAVLYSGPKTYDDVQACAKTGDPAKCNLHVISSLTTDPAALTAALKSMTWPKASSFTAGALNMAKTLLKEGRKDSQSVVLAFTHEMPNFKCQAEEASAELRKVARLMWLPIGKYAELEDLERWASSPVRANVYPIADYAALAKPELLQDLIATICPKVA